RAPPERRRRRDPHAAFDEQQGRDRPRVPDVADRSEQESPVGRDEREGEQHGKGSGVGRRGHVVRATVVGRAPRSKVAPRGYAPAWSPASAHREPTVDPPRRAAAHTSPPGATSGSIARGSAMRLLTLVV